MPGPFRADQLQASSGPAGMALVNATPTFLSWTAPNDGNLHRFTIELELVVATLEVGGQISVSRGTPGTNAVTVFASALAAGSYSGHSVAFALQGLLQPGDTILVNQSAALTSGAATLYGEIWGS